MKIQNNYHGIKPVTASDMVMAGNHLKSTLALVESKIADHQDAIKKATVPASKTYNQSHVQKHLSEKKSIQQSISTLRKMKGGSAGLQGYLAKKKIK